MLQSEDKADAPQGRDGAPGGVAIRGLSARLVQILPNLVLLVLAIWPAVVLIGSVRLPEFNVSLPGLLVAFNAFVLAALFLIALQGRARKLNLTVSAVACFAAFCAGELVLKWQHKSIRSIAETWIVRRNPQADSAVAGVALRSTPSRLAPVDRRSDDEMLKVLVHYRRYPAAIVNIAQLLPALEAGELPRFLPLSGLSNAVVFSCNEGDQRQNPVYRTDRFGFNNEDWVYLWDREKIMLVGDSFAAGSCVHQEQSVQGVMRRAGFAAFSTGVGGMGPLMELASLSEYGGRMKPRSVFWLYFDGNDIHDLRIRELKSSFLLQYLRDDYSQGLIDRQGETDQYWDDFAADNWRKMKAIQEKVIKQTWTISPESTRANLEVVRRDLALPDLDSLNADADVVHIFKAILATAERRVRAWGGELYFVMIPNKDDYHGRIPPYRRAVLDAVQELGIPIVDVDRPLRESGDPLQFYPLRNAYGHFNPEGYRVVAFDMIQNLITQRQKSGKPIALEELDPEYRKLARINAELAALRRLNPRASIDLLLQSAKGRPVQTDRVDYHHYATVTNVLEDDGRATDKSGTTMLGSTFQTKQHGNSLRVHARINVLSETNNRAVLALYMDADVAPRAIARQALAANVPGVVELDYRMLLTDVSPHSVTIRIGPAQEGRIFINGSANGPAEQGSDSFIETAEISLFEE